MRSFLLITLCVGCLTACFNGKPGREENPVVRGVHYVGMSVQDLEDSVEFYHSIVDLAEVPGVEIRDLGVLQKVADNESLTVSSTVLASVNAQVRMMEFSGHQTESEVPHVEVYGPGIAHLCFQVHQDTGAYFKFLEKGGKVIGEKDMMLNPKTHVSYAYGRDLNDSIVEFEHVDVEALELATPPKNDQRIRHISLATPDIDKAVEFYSHLLQEKYPRRTGWFKVSGDKIDTVTGEADSKLAFAWFQIRNLELEIIEYVSHETDVPQTPRPLSAHGYNMIVFDVTDIDAARTRLLEAGGEIVLEESAMDGGKILFGRDLDMNLLGFQVLSDDSPLSSQKFDGNGL